MRKTFERKACDLLQAIEDACKELPPHWEIMLLIQKEEACVYLLDETDYQVDYPSDHESLEGSIIDALAFAKQTHHKNQE